MKHPGLLERAGQNFSRFLRDTRGSIALKFALAGPAVIMLAVGAVDLLAVSSAQGRLQSIADAGALNGARYLKLAADNVLARERAAAFVDAEMSQWVDGPSYEAAYEVSDGPGPRGLTVRLDGHRPSFFANMLPPGGWRFTATATASPAAQTPLCILGTTGLGMSKGVIANSGTGLRAPLCMVHSNSDMHGIGSIDAALAQTTGIAIGSGFVSPPGTGAVAIADPFDDFVYPAAPSSCVSTGPITLTANQTRTVSPGLYCHPIRVAGNSVLILRPGEYWFNQEVRLSGNGIMRGEDVVLFIEPGFSFRFDGQNPRVDLIGRKSGPYGGMLMVRSPSGQHPNLEIRATNVERLLGVIYVPNGDLNVRGSGNAASDSAWTIVVAKRVMLHDRASLIINADYDGSDVPVPSGVGPNASAGGRGGPRLVN